MDFAGYRVELGSQAQTLHSSQQVIHSIKTVSIY